MAETSATARYICEFVGTFLLVFTVGCAVAPSGDKVFGVTSIAAVLMVSIYAMGPASGGHFNPSVSIACFLAGKMDSAKECAIYCATQIAAGVSAGLLFYLVLGSGGTVGPAAGFTFLHAGLAEVLYTAMLAFVVLCTACNEKNHPDIREGIVHTKNQYFALSIGFVVIAGGYGAGAISGGCFNPAVALGLDVSSLVSSQGFGWGFAYFGFEVLGSVLAVALFYLTYPSAVGKEPLFEDSERYASEFIGTFYLVLTVGLNVNNNSSAGGWSIAASLMCMIFSMGVVSGGHFNPAVTLAVWLSKRPGSKPGDFNTHWLPRYIGCQLLGGVVAAYTYAMMCKGQTFPLGPKEGYGWPSALFLEMLFTAVLCFVVLSVATVRVGMTQYFGLAIGSCVTAGGIAIGNISGGSLNPGVSVGISSARLIGGGMGYPCLVYGAAEFVGAGLAAAVFRLTQPSEFVGFAKDP